MHKRSGRVRDALATPYTNTSRQTTFDLYGHLMPGNAEEAVALVNAYLDRGDTARRISQISPET